jgi:hypothetical protein
MIRKMLLGAALAVLVIAPAHAGVSLQGRALNGFTLNGAVLQGISIQGWQLNGVRSNPIGVDVGGHGGVGLNGKVIAIEF